MNKAPVLYLMLGIPGAGKTTTAKIIAELTGGERLSSDEERLRLFPHPSFSEAEHRQVYNHLDREVERLLKDGVTVIYDANLNRHRHRNDKYQLAERCGAAVILVWVDVAHELAKQRRIHEVHHHHLVPSFEDPGSMFERISRVFEPPHPDEPYISIDGTKVNTDYVREKLGLTGKA